MLPKVKMLPRIAILQSIWVFIGLLNFVFGRKTASDLPVTLKTKQGNAVWIVSCGVFELWDDMFVVDQHGTANHTTEATALPNFALYLGRYRSTEPMLVYFVGHR